MSGIRNRIVFVALDGKSQFETLRNISGTPLSTLLCQARRAGMNFGYCVVCVDDEAIPISEKDRPIRTNAKITVREVRRTDDTTPWVID